MAFKIIVRGRKILIAAAHAKHIYVIKNIQTNKEHIFLLLFPAVRWFH